MTKAFARATDMFKYTHFHKGKNGHKSTKAFRKRVLEIQEVLYPINGPLFPDRSAH